MDLTPGGPVRHGIDAYFAEQDRFRRRLAGLGFVVTVVFLALSLVAQRRAIVAALNDPRRFGFEGPEQYVERIRLETLAEQDKPGVARGDLVTVNLRRGGGRQRPVGRGTRPVPDSPAAGRGPGIDDLDLNARVRAFALRGPVVRSEDLVVEKLVRPEYPEEARDKGIEGVIELIALVDTTGEVREVHVVGGAKEPLLEEAATRAVLQCVYRPYRVRTTVERVWAYYRISFSLF